MRHMTETLTLLVLLLAAGCCGPRQRVVFNNTGHVLRVSQNGKLIATLENGEQVGLDENFLIPKTVVTVSAFTPDGQYVGADSWTFLSNNPEVWQINEVRRPQESR